MQYTDLLIPTVEYDSQSTSEQTVDVLTDLMSGIRLVISRKGAEMIGLARLDRDGDWVGFLNRDFHGHGDAPVPQPAGGWAGHATVMGYYVHRLRNGRSLYRGHEIRGGNHGMLRTKTFGPPSVWADAITYRLEPEQIAPGEYPLRVAFSITYSLSDSTVQVEFRFENREPDLVAHVGFGLHPGLAAASLDAADLLMPAGRYRRLLAPGNFLSGERETIDHHGGSMPFSRADMPDSFLLDLAGIAPREFTFVDHGSGRNVLLTMPEAPYLTLWSDGGPFLCVEPCWGLPDHETDRPFEQKPGIQTIAPGGFLIRKFSMQPFLASHPKPKARSR